MSVPKWENTGAPITTVESLIACIGQYGGCYIFGGCRNKDFALSQDLRTIVNQITCGMTFYPRRIAKPKTNRMQK